MRAELIDWMGNDNSVVNAARVSFDKLAEQYPEERNVALIRYLARHGHFSPFTHPQLTFRYTVPIFVARQEFKHIVGFTRNEVSRRYVDDEPEFFVPKVWRSRPDGSVKQGSGEGNVSVLRNCDKEWKDMDILRAYDCLVDSCQTLYESMIQNGVAPEQARMVLPQSMYTSYHITGSLAAFARFYRQRSDSHAQQEIQELANMVGPQVAKLFPHSWDALTND